MNFSILNFCKCYTYVLHANKHIPSIKEMLLGCMCGLWCSLWTIDYVVCTHVYSMHVWYISLLQCGVLWGVLCGVYCLKQSSICHLKIIPQSTLPEQSIFIMLEQLWKLKGILPKILPDRDSVYLSCMLWWSTHSTWNCTHEYTRDILYTHEISEHTQET